MVFGVFDGLHKGHEYFLREAGKLGDRLVAVITTDENVEKLKGRPPEKPFRERVEHVQGEDSVHEVIPNDSVLDSWGVLKSHQPDIIALGYDQTDLKKALENYLEKTGQRIELKVIESFEPHRYKSSLMNHNTRT